MKIKRLVLGLVNVNCYLVETEKCAIVIDPGMFNAKLEDFLNENKNKERIILITHSHFDHIGGAKELREKTSVPIGIGKSDEMGLSDPSVNLSARFGSPLPKFSADFLYSDQDEIKIGDLSIKVIKTSGHTEGSVCYLIENSLFSGDMLFFESFGRTDFPSGSDEKIRESFFKLMTTLPDETVVYPGHGDKTTIAHERQYNPLTYLSAL